MDRARKHMPVGNRITYQKYLQRCKKVHKKKLKTIKASIDNKMPKSHKMTHLKSNLKKAQMMEERFTTIERENRLLLEKMSQIMQHKTLDNHCSSLKYSRSLNIDSRRRQLIKITKENQKILKRIQISPATYDHNNWDSEYLKNIEYMENIAEYKYSTRNTASIKRRPNTSHGYSSKSSRTPTVNFFSSRNRTKFSNAGGGFTNDSRSSMPVQHQRPATSAGGGRIISRKSKHKPTVGSKVNYDFISEKHLTPVRVPRVRDGGDVLIYNESRTLPAVSVEHASAAVELLQETSVHGYREIGPLRVSVWDIGSTTSMREDASSGVKIVAEEPKISGGQTYEMVLSVEELKAVISDSTILHSTLDECLVLLDNEQQLFTRVHAALDMRSDPRMAMQLGAHLLNLIMVDITRGKLKFRSLNNNDDNNNNNVADRDNMDTVVNSTDEKNFWKALNESYTASTEEKATEPSQSDVTMLINNDNNNVTRSMEENTIKSLNRTESDAVILYDESKSSKLVDETESTDEIYQNKEVKEAAKVADDNATILPYDEKQTGTSPISSLSNNPNDVTLSESTIEEKVNS